MLCSPSAPAMSFEHGRHHDTTPLGASSSTTCSNSARTLPSSGTPAGPSMKMARDSNVGSHARPRHHSRGYSQERVSTADEKAAASVGASTSATMDASPAIVIDPSSPPITSPVLSSTSAALPVRLKRQPSAAQLAATAAAAAAAASSSSTATPSGKKSPSPPQSQAHSPTRPTGSPSKQASSLDEINEQEKLQLLRNQQANRRPKMMRLTPAFSSTPNRLPTSSQRSHSMQKSSSHDSATSSTAAVRFPGGGNDDGDDPAVGLQIDLRCIPSPSLYDLNGPLSTSRLDGMARDRNGNPIKPSLKSPRSSVSHFLPGRTSRSDSSPAIPSALHSKSVPTTPTVQKAVHFDSQLEHVKVFKFKQRPTAVSRDGSPEQTETETEEEKDLFPYIWRKNSSSPVFGQRSTSPQKGGSASKNISNGSLDMPPETEEQLVLRLPNFPSSTRLAVDREVFLERIYLADDLRSVKGTVQVRNMSFEKWVAIRYTLDHWATIGEVSAEYAETIKGGQADRFTFSIKLNELLNWPRGSAGHITKSMFMCLRYTVNNAEFWDNNEGSNYQLDFRKRQVPTTPLSTPVASLNMAQPRAFAGAAMPHSTSTRTKVFDLARKGGVGGKGVFAMEDLKRELDKLRSDEEEEIQSITAMPRTIASEMKKRASPPSSPGRSGSPSASPWTARYDIGQSLRNPRNGSRNTGSGRAAALDYFSAKPMPRSPLPYNGEEQMRPPSAPATVGSAATLPAAASLNGLTDSRFDAMARAAQDSPDFSHKFGMISPGLGDGPVEHRPTSSSDSNVPSANVSPSPTPTPTSHRSPLTKAPLELPSDRFNSFPPSRHGIGSAPVHLNGGGRLSPAFFTPTEEVGSEQPSPAPLIPDIEAADLVAAAVSKAKGIDQTAGAVIVEDFSPPASSSSGCASPNPFSPTDSVSSVDSDTTVSNATVPEDRLQKVAKTGNGANAPAHARIAQSKPLARVIPLQPEKNTSLTTPRDTPAVAAANSFDPNNSSLRAMDTSPLILSEVNADRVRPASMSDYQELINRYCWNSDLVPSGGSTIPDMPMNGGLGGSMMLAVDGQATAHKLSPKLRSPALGSGASTPTMH